MVATTIEEWQLRMQPDRLLAELYQARGQLHQEATPQDPRIPLEHEIAGIRHMPATDDGVVLVARDSARTIAGLCTCTWNYLPGWDHVLDADIAVLPSWRRQGLGTLLLELSAAVAWRRGLRLVTGSTRDSVPVGAEFCRQFGAEQALVAEENRLDLATIDRDLVDQWITDGPVRAPSYRLLFVDGCTPPDLADRVAEALNIMNTAPRENLDVGDVQMTADLLREFEEAAAATGKRRWSYYAQDRSGRFVGLTSIVIEPGTPDRVHVGDTAVDPAHRGRGLGKWLKAAITRQILAGLPGVRWVITYNAGSNDSMLAINRQLGFHTAAVHTMWQIGTSNLRDTLGAGGEG